MKCSRSVLRYAAVAVSGLTLAATTLAGTAAATAGPGAAAQAAAARPVIKLVAAQNKITVGSFQGQVFLDPGIWVASLNSALVFDVQRRSYTRPVTITQIIHLPGGGTRSRPLPGSVLSGFDGLQNFVRVRVSTPGGKTVATQTEMFCPNTFDPQRASPNSPANSPYPQQCSSGDPFTLGSVWGVAKGWAVDPMENGGSSFQLALGTYKVTVTITPRYVRLLHISARDATASVTMNVVNQQQCCGRPVPARPAGRHGQLPSAPAVPTLRNPPQSALPDLVALPSWGIFTSHIRARKIHPASDWLDFNATVWIGGSSPLDVEGFRSHGSPVMTAYQYFSRNGRVIGRVRAGTMGFETGPGENHWHFKQFARYSLLNSSRTQAVLSHKEGFCIAPTDGVDLLLPHASWQQSFGFGGGACGLPTGLWVRETLPVGWGDTYSQSSAGQAFNITSLPNGTYYIEIIANPQRVLRETTTSNDISMRKVILGGTPGHRTVHVPAWHGLDPEG